MLVGLNSLPYLLARAADAVRVVGVRRQDAEICAIGGDKPRRAGLLRLCGRREGDEEANDKGSRSPLTTVPDGGGLLVRSGLHLAFVLSQRVATHRAICGRRRHHMLLCLIDV